MITAKPAIFRSQYSRSILSLRWQSTEKELQPSEPVQYPPIMDLSPKGIYRTQQQNYAERIKNEIPTVEQKIHSLNLPKYYGWPSYMIREKHLPYNYLPFAQFITRTVVSENHNLPLYKTDDNLQRLINQLKTELEKLLLFENSIRYRHEVESVYANEEDMPFYTPAELKDLKVRPFIKQFNNVITRVLAADYRHLYTAQLDLDPRAEAFWRVGGFYPTADDCKLRTEKKIDESMINDPIDRFMQYFGSPILQLRSKLPLPPLPKIDIELVELEQNFEKEIEIMQISSSEDVSSNSTDSSVQIVPKTIQEVTTVDEAKPKDKFIYPLQEFRYMADLYLNIPRERQLGTTVPGFYPNDVHRFGIVSYHSLSHLLDRPPHYGSDDAIEALHAQAILASYAWTYAQACYQGFTTYNDITYPFTNQVILTDGKAFSFYQYQLNTILLHSENNEPQNPVCNECYATAPMELYHEIGVDKVQGWNDKALLNLLSIYTNTPNDRGGIDFCPYLNKEVKLISQISDADERLWWYKKVDWMLARRPRHKLPPEIYDWERIFKIENQRRVKDARKRFFEKGEDPINDRTLIQHNPEYINKRDRAKKAPVWKKMYYKEVFPEYPEIV